MALDDTHVYWVDNETKVVLRVLRSGGRPEATGLTVEDEIGQLVRSGDWLFGAAADRVDAVSVVDGKLATLAGTSDVGRAVGSLHTALVVDAQDVFFAMAAWRNEQPGIPHIDLTGPNGGAPAETANGRLVRLPLSMRLPDPAAYIPDREDDPGVALLLIVGRGYEHVEGPGSALAAQALRRRPRGRPRGGAQSICCPMAGYRTIPRRNPQRSARRFDQIDRRAIA